jgi:hypothetical protein
VRFAFVFREMLVMSRSGLVVGLSLRRMRWQGPITVVSASSAPLPATAQPTSGDADIRALKYPSQIAVNGWRRSCQAVHRGYS